MTFAHEIEGYVLQNENKARVGLKLFEKLGSGHSTLLAENGAMYKKDTVSQKVFDFRSFPYPHYIKAMLKKQEGGI